MYGLRGVMRRLAGFDAAFWRADNNGILDWGKSRTYLFLIEAVRMRQDLGRCQPENVGAGN
ncbi:hypothetical protein D3C73_1620680 [compost metagenome]